MGNDMGFGPWLTSGAPAIWAGFFLLCAWYIRTRPLWKQKATEAALAADTIEGNQNARLEAEIARHTEEIKELRTAEGKCRDELVMTKERLAALEGYNLGIGKAYNEAQRIVSKERQDLHKDKEEKAE